jgi:two-component system, NarL family, nitrate/nitrite response regulator NarL
MFRHLKNLPSPPMPKPGPVSVLIAEDHVLVAEALSCMLERYGRYRCDIVHDALDAKAALRANPGYDIVLLDLNMPGLAGLPDLADMVACAGDTPVLLLTADDQVRVDAAFAAGVRGISFKHHPASETRKAMAKVLSGYRHVPCPPDDSARTQTLRHAFCSDGMPVLTRTQADAGLPAHLR